MSLTSVQRLALGVALLGLVLAGCGDGDDGPRRATPTATPAAAASPTPTPAGGTPTASPTGTRASSPVSPPATLSPTPTRSLLEVGLRVLGADGWPGATVEIAVVLERGGVVAGTQNDIGFAPETQIAALSNGRPDCAVNPAIDKNASSFAFQPSACVPGETCTAVRALVLALDNVDPIPIGSTLYTCRATIAVTAAADAYPLTCSLAGASDPEGNAPPTVCEAGVIRPVGAIPSPTPTPGGDPGFTATPALTATQTATPNTGAGGPVAPLAAAGRWLVDDLGRVVMLHGVNMVAKRAPFHPSAFGFGADDAAFLAGEGFNALRLGVDFRGLMPAPGIVETAYIDALAETVEALVAEDIFVLIDFHQDGFAPMYNGNGLPDWMAIDDGLPNPPDAVFPLYYIQNPAMQRAFESFWANRAGPGGVGLQDYFVQGVEAVAARFAAQPLVIGTELMNEPWPGADWMACALEAGGCPGLEDALLRPFYDRGATAARRAAPDQLVWVEPFVLFNFGQAQTSLPGADPRLALSFHSYALDVAGEEAVVANAVAAAARDGRPLLCTEFGASTDPVLLNRLTAQLESALVPWLFWTYDEAIIADEHAPAGPDNLRSVEAFGALVRPYPVATNGTPTAIAFDPPARRFTFAYDAAGPAGDTPPWVLTVVSIPPRHYPDGYVAHVTGAQVVSAPGAELLLLRRDQEATRVSVEVVPASP